MRRLTFTAAIISVLSWAAQADERPNILLLVAEDLSPRIGAFGDEVARTPSIDALAEQGVRFPNVFTAAGVCAPSRAALITGWHQESIGAHHMRSNRNVHGPYLATPPPSVKAFPEHLRRAGYFTFTDRKLDYQFSEAFADSGPFTIWDQEGADSSWLARRKGQPFFGLVNFLETHESALFSPWQQFSSGQWLGGLIASMRGWQRWRLAERTDPAQVVVPPYYPDNGVVRESMATFYDNVQVMDAAVGEILARLEAEGLADSTIVIWTTDHGDALPRAKREVFDSGVRVPMIVRWPERWRPAHLALGAVDERLVSFVDLAPTILRWAGVTGVQTHGRDIVRDEAREFVYAARDRIDSRDDRLRAVRDARYKYIVDLGPSGTGATHIAYRDQQPIMQALWSGQAEGTLTAAQSAWLEHRPAEALFDLEEDPHELNNLAASATHAEVLERMRAAMGAKHWPDQGEQHESELASRFWPDGRQPITAPVRCRLDEQGMVLESDTPGASIGYRAMGEEAWRLYHEPLAQMDLEAKAVRYGWLESRVELCLAANPGAS